jgi:multiple sugar transport system substrate-binding protein/raffinose/stachyose/melibiose transport system substrate-binding protein
MTKFGLTWRRGFAMVAGMALAAAALPGAVAAQEDAGEVVVMTYFSADLGEPAFKQLLADFEAETGITVNIVDVGHEDFKTGILIQLAGGNPPDVHTNWAGARTAFQVENDSLAPIDDVWAANGLDDQFGAGMIESAVTYDGTKYLLPFGFHIAPMFYNPTVFADAGVEIPTTFDELKAACEAFSAAGILPISLGSAAKWPAQFWFDYLLLRTAGAEYRAQLMAGDASYADDEVVRAMGLWAELFDAGCFPDGPTANSLVWTDAADQLVNGEAAMNLMGTWLIGYVVGNGFEPVTDFDFFEFPIVDEGVPSAVVGPVDGLVTAAGAANSENAMAMLEFLARPESQAAWSVGQGNMPTNTTSDTAEFNDLIKRAMEIAAASETYNFNYDLATPPAPSEVGLDMFQRFINDQGDIEGLLGETQTAVEAAFEG